MRAAVALLAVLLLAGCITVPRQSARDMQGHWPSSGGLPSGTTWTVEVVDQEGRALPGANVLAYWDVGAEYEGVRLQSDASGLARFTAPTGGNVTATAWAPGRAEQWFLHVGPETGTRLTAVLFPERLQFELHGTWRLYGEDWRGYPGTACDLQELTYGSGPAAAAFGRALSAADLELRWTNGVPQGIGDWELAYLRPDLNDAFTFGHTCPDSEGAFLSDAAPGAHSSRLHLDQGDLQEGYWEATQLYVGPVSHGGTVAVDVEYVILVDATLRRDQIEMREGEPEGGGTAIRFLGGPGTGGSPASHQAPAAGLALLCALLLGLAAGRRR